MTRASEVLAKGVVLLDGAMATSLFARGLALDASPGAWNLSHPDDVRAVHEGFLAAGCEVIQTNSFLLEGLEPESARAAARLAREAVEVHDRGYVAGNLGPLPPGTPPSGVQALVEPIARVLAEEGVDWIGVETLSDLDLARAEVEAAARASGLEVSACVTLSADEADLHVLGGASLAEAAQALEQAGAVALGINCSAGSAQVARALPALLAATRLPLIAKPNAGRPRLVDGALSWPVDPATFAADLMTLVELGAAAVGGCCGTGPAHLAAARAALDARAG